MALDVKRLRALVFDDVEHVYSKRDTMLYALGVGLGSPATDPAQLRFVYEENLHALPTQAVVLGYPGFWLKDKDTGLDWKAILHVGQHLHLHQPLPPQGRVIGRTRIAQVYDKGAGSGAVLHIHRDIIDARTGAALATVLDVQYCRGEGGFGGEPPPKRGDAPMPEHAPDIECALPTSERAALIYRLTGDDNPLHADPAVARAAGFDKPILHGLCTLGVIGHALVKTVCAYQPETVRALHAQFTSPVYPGETLLTRVWKTQDPGMVRYDTWVQERNIKVVDQGVLAWTAGIAFVA